MNKRTIQRHLLSVDTSTVENALPAIEEYVAISIQDRPLCRAVAEDATVDQTGGSANG